MSPSDEDPRLGRALGAMAKGQQAQAVFNYLEAYLIGRQQRIDQQLYTALEQGAEVSFESICREKYEAHKFVQNLYALMRAGEGGARLLQPMMDHSEHE